MKQLQRERRVFRVRHNPKRNTWEVFDPRNGRTLCHCVSLTTADRVRDGMNDYEKKRAAKPRG